MRLQLLLSARKHTAAYILRLFPVSLIMLISVDAGSSSLLVYPSLTARSSQLRYSRRAALRVSARQAEETAANATSSIPAAPGGPDVRAKRVVVLGGTGRVGRSTAVALAEATKGGKDEDGGIEFPIDLVVAGRNR